MYRKNTTLKTAKEKKKKNSLNIPVTAERKLSFH
jgi:hypothetical protein